MWIRLPWPLRCPSPFKEGVESFAPPFTAVAAQVWPRQGVPLIAEPPIITTRDEASVTVARGAPKTLFCSASGTPQPHVRWFKDEAVATEGLQTDGSFLIARADLSDAGEYTCEASNEAGTDRYTVRVHVLRRWSRSSDRAIKRRLSRQ
ncbi:hypothetical protein HPB48_007116 [Haemaphysalis longicornis]|uniref:Ig-like domain-containing protein n=1 Tax=Haemaphysalis longicornis TaxID=44386 RepID=A0A9J6FAE9_HAELO|nr:hypothetical protein HPB48_007116 [Haemaphysalis longicornis]